MEDHTTDAIDSRIDALQQAGSLRPDEAGALRRAFVSGQAPGAASANARARGFPSGGRAFLAGLISADELRRRGRRQAVTMGLLFAVLFGALTMWLGAGHASWSALLAVQGPLAALAGVAFGWSMYVALLRPAIERHVQLRAAAGPLLPIEGADAGQCPSCRAEQFDVWTWRKPAMLHWIVNPGLAFNELVLGQRLPANPKICRQCGAHSVDCPHCHRAIDVAAWAGRPFGNWLGLRCPYCDGQLPMLSNALAWLVRAPFSAVVGLFAGRGGRS